MRSLRMFALAAVAAGAIALAGCQSAGDFIASLAHPSATEAVTVGAAEQAYTTAAHLEIVWLQSGKATAAQAAVAKTFREAVYADVVAGREAVAHNDSAAIKVALRLFDQALPAFSGYIADHGGSP